MSIPKHAVRIDIDVPFNHCDPLQVVWHGRYLEYFEAARTKLLRSIELDAPQLQAMGYRMYMVDARIRYLSPLRYGDMARVTTWFSSVRPHIRMAYLVDNVTQGARSARGYTVIATTTAAGELITETPHQLIERLPADGLRSP